MTEHRSSPDQLMARALGVCWHSPTSDRWPCAATEPAQIPPLDPTNGLTWCVRCLSHYATQHKPLCVSCLDDEVQEAKR